MDDLKSYLESLYGDKSEMISSEIQACLQQYPCNDNPFPNPLWYKSINLYVVYPDGVASGEGSPLSRLIPYLAHVKQLGCNAIHILPFLDSPLVDAGFDISDYMKIRPDLGNMDDLRQLITEARNIGIYLFMDMVANHVSEEHAWFQKAQSGDEKYRNYFIFQKEEPQFIKTFHKASAVWARYLVNEKQKDVNIAFPEQAGAIPHWREGKDHYWYYHTYYPQQLDLNWHNPDVFIEFAKIVIHWASMGFNFRLDALPFVGKGAYKKTDEETMFASRLAVAYNYIGEFINPECVTIAESYEKIATVTKYFGTSNVQKSQLAYNFHLCTYIWIALVKGDVHYIWKKLNELGNIPIHAEWINFLRNPDELSLAYVREPLLTEIKEALMKHGEPFREGYGISGRTRSLLGGSEERLVNAYFLLACLPGSILVPYGDEMGKENIPFAALPQRLREDTRNINRGSISLDDLTSPADKRVQDMISEILNMKQRFREYLNILPQRLPSPRSVFAAVYKFGVSELVVLVNITGKTQKVDAPAHEYSNYKKILAVQKCDYRKDQIILSPYAGIVLQK